MLQLYRKPKFGLAFELPFAAVVEFIVSGAASAAHVMQARIAAARIMTVLVEICMVIANGCFEGDCTFCGAS